MKTFAMKTIAIAVEQFQCYYRHETIVRHL